MTRRAMTARAVLAAGLLLAALGAGAAPAAAASRTLVVDAPDALRTVLETHLDLAHATRLVGDEAALDDVEWARLIAAAPAQARNLAQTEGYFAAEVRVEVPADAPRTLHVIVQPGPQARIGRLTLNLDGELDRLAGDGDAGASALRDALRRGFALQPGTPFRNAQWSDAKAQTLAQLRAAGYAAAQWSGTSAEFDPASGRMRLFLVADSGPRFIAGEVRIEGLEHQPERTVRQLTDIAPGQPLTEALLLAAQDRLEKTRLFDQVSVTWDPDPEQADQTVVRVRVHEQLLRATSVSAGISANTGPRVTLEHTQRLAFGLPASLHNKLEWGRDLHQWTGDLATHPAEHFHSWLLGGTVSRLVTAQDVVKQGSMRLGRTQDTPRLERLSFVQAERSTTCVAQECDDARALTLNQHVVWRELDSVVLPTRGWTLSLQGGGGLTGGPHASYRPFARLYGRGTGYWPVGKSWYGMARLELGQVSVRGTAPVPDAELFRAGGDDSVRGYPYRSLAPKDSQGNTIGGRSLVTASAEIAHPFSPTLPSVWWAAFVDAGQAVEHLDDLHLAAGYGLGVRWRSPVGPLRLDWAWGEQLHRGRIHLSVGIAF